MFIYLFLKFLAQPEACRTLVPRPAIELTPPALEGGPLTTGPPGKSQPNLCFSTELHIKEIDFNSSLKLNWVNKQGKGTDVGFY